jgi:hypothetical protein
MSLLAIFSVRRQRLAAQWAKQIAHRVHPDVWQRVATRAMGMHLAEARGYVRARAAALVQAESRHLARGDAALAAQLAERAMPQVVQLIFRDLLQVPPYGAVRKAA